MLPFGVTIPATVPQRSEIPEGLMNYPVLHWAVSEQRSKKEQLVLRKKRVYEDVSNYLKKFFIFDLFA